MGISLYEYCKARGSPGLIEEWDKEKNGDISADNTSYGSHYMAWWKCSKGHEWQAMVKSRAKGAICPYCASKRISPGENDLATTYPELVREWCRERNGEVTPESVFGGSQVKVWWQCEKGHTWKATVASRTICKTGCPVCAGRTVLAGFNDLATLEPEVASEWHPTLNGDMTANDVTAYSNKSVWWRCTLGHEWEAHINSRTKSGAGCPYCAGRKVLKGFNDLATVEPKVAAQWHPTLNGDLKPDEVVSGSHKKVWWQCREGHVWRAVIYSRTGKQQCGCPVCAGRSRAKYRGKYETAARAQGSNERTENELR